jgi:hypothetical protein
MNYPLSLHSLLIMFSTLRLIFPFVDQHARFSMVVEFPLYLPRLNNYNYTTDNLVLILEILPEC